MKVYFVHTGVRGTTYKLVDKYKHKFEHLLLSAHVVLKHTTTQHFSAFKHCFTTSVNLVVRAKALKNFSFIYNSTLTFQVNLFFFKGSLVQYVRLTLKQI